MKVKYKNENSKFIESNKDLFNLLIITATQIEKDAILNILKPISGQSTIIKVAKNKQTYFLGSFGQFNAIHINCGKMGSSGRESSLITTRDAIEDWSPKVVLMVGIAFGVDEKTQKIGDVLVAEQIVSYEPQKIKGGKTLQRGNIGACCSTLLNRFRNCDDWEYNIGKRQAAIIIGEILSGEKLVDDLAFRNRLIKENPNAKGGEMEGAGLYSACDGRVTSWILVKGICDYADGKKGIRKDKKQIIAVNSAISLCEFVFSSYSNLDSIGLSNSKTEEQKSVENSLIEILTKQVEIQLKKQINSGKYLKDTFVETGQQKDQLRYFSDSVFYYQKLWGETTTLDFRLFNFWLSKKGLSFNFDFKNRFPSSIESTNYRKNTDELESYFELKLKEIEGLDIDKNNKWRFRRKLEDKGKEFAFLKSKIAIITDFAGQGKTNLICDLCENFFLKRSIPTVFLTGSDLMADRLEESMIKKILPDLNNLTFLELIKQSKGYCFKHNKFFVLIIDGVNEVSNPHVFSRQLELLIEKLVEFDWLKIILTCRTEYYINNFENLKKSSFAKEIIKITSLKPDFQNENLSEKLLDIYFEYFEITYHTISDKPYQQLISNPLLLRIFCETYAKSNIGNLNSIHKAELFSLYYIKHCEQINRRLNEGSHTKLSSKFDIKKFITSIVELMIKKKIYSNIPLDHLLESELDLQDVYLRFIDENLLIKKDLGQDQIFGNSEVVNFTFDEFRDFLISKYLIDDLYPRSLIEFETFLESEITDNSPLIEGCGSFLFFISKTKHDLKLDSCIEKQVWYNRVFIKNIFDLSDSNVSNSDKERLTEYFLDQKMSNHSIILKLIRRTSNDFKNLNIDFLFELLQPLDDVKLKKLFSDEFDNGKYYEIEQEKLLEKISETLEENILDSNYHKLFELVIYMFANSGNMETMGLYEKFYYRYPEIAKLQLARVLSSNSMNLKSKISIFLNLYEIKL